MKRNTRTILALLLVAAIGLAAGCAPKAAVQDVGVTAMAITNYTPAEYEYYTSSGYDTTPLQWNVEQNTLQSSNRPALHVTYVSNDYGLSWSSGSPILAVQRWDHPSTSMDMTALLTTTSKDVSILVPPEGSQSSPVVGEGFDRWYAPGDKAFLTITPKQLLDVLPSQKTPDSMTMTITEYPLAAGSKTQTLTVPFPAAFALSVAVYGSGSISNGFVLLDVPIEPMNNIAQFDLWLLRMHDGEATLVKCSNPTRFSADLYSAVNASFAHVGSLLYFTHGEGQIGYIDTAAAAPSIIVPDKINALLDKLRKTKPMEPAPIQAFLASDSGTLIIGYPDVNWNEVYYAVDATGTVLGSLRADKTSATSFNAEGKQGTSLALQAAQQYLLFPSVDLFVTDV
jgi:hypothetical protein